MVESHVIPNSFQPLYGPEDIAREVCRLGADIDKWAEEVWNASHSEILAIPILRGGIFFFADLVRQIKHSVEIAPARTWAYENEAFKERVKIEVNIEEVPAKGRALLIIDDICDTGKTLHALGEAFMRAGALSVKAAVLVRREIPGQIYKPEWEGFVFHGSEWLVGYGMDNCDSWRNLPGIYTIKQNMSDS